ncbi:efflux transporter outer membrane subunit [soil metagenome]
MIVPRHLPAVALASALTLGGCQQLQFAPLKPLPVAGSFAASDLPAVPAGAAAGWLGDFDSPALSRLVRGAVGGNYDLEAAAARIAQAEAQARIAGAGRAPRLGLDLSANRSQNLRGSEFSTVRANQFQAGLSLDWEIDLWGRLRDQTAAALAQLDAASADYQAARLSLAANTAKTALDLLAARLSADLARETLASLQTNLDILDRQLELGNVEDSTALDISLSRADVARARATVATNSRAADGFRRRLETLLGTYPAGALDGLSTFPDISRKVPPGLPSELLLRRPDMRAAEARARAAIREHSAARKALLPSIRLTGGAGTSTTQDIGDLLDLDNLVWNIGAGLTQPIFQGGELHARAELSKAELREVAATYAEAALNAFREVETALAAEILLAEEQARLDEAVEESDRAEALALSNYENGIVDITTVLSAQRTAFEARRTRLETINLRAQNRIDLYLALGGDFDHAPGK